MKLKFLQEIGMADANTFARWVDSLPPEGANGIAHAYLKAIQDNGRQRNRNIPGSPAAQERTGSEAEISFLKDMQADVGHRQKKQESRLVRYERT